MLWKNASAEEEAITPTLTSFPRTLNRHGNYLFFLVLLKSIYLPNNPSISTSMSTPLSIHPCMPLSLYPSIHPSIYSIPPWIHFPYFFHSVSFTLGSFKLMNDVTDSFFTISTINFATYTFVNMRTKKASQLERYLAVNVNGFLLSPTSRLNVVAQT